jgi:PEP-CTERM motif
MNVKGALIALLLAIAGAAFATPNAFAEQHVKYYGQSKVPALTFASQSRQNFYNWDICVRFDDWGHHGGGRLESVFSVRDTKWEGPNLGHDVAPAPEPETYALMLAGLLAVFMVARRRRGGS